MIYVLSPYIIIVLCDELAYYAYYEHRIVNTNLSSHLLPISHAIYQHMAPQ